ncbi:Stress-induced-phospho 1, partial [Paramuricea clavata]
EKLLYSLQNFQTLLNKEIRGIKENVDRLKLEQLTLHNQYVSTVQDVEKIKSKVAKMGTTTSETPYVFYAPRKNPWFAGRLTEIEDLASLLQLDQGTTSKPKVNTAAVCGLGGVGKTSLATEYAQQRKDFYTGGVYWFSGEDNTTFENSVYDVATRFGTQRDSFGLTFSATLEMISRNKNPWLIILDNMDQSSLSSNVVKLVSGPWQQDASGHLVITTRRKPTALANDIRDFDERCVLSLKCFEIEEGKKFLFRRVGTVHDEEVDRVAEKLVQQLGGLPLALEQAGAYIKSLPCTIPQYLELYEKQHLRLLNRQKATPVSVYDSPERLAVRTTWHLNFEHIKQSVDDGKSAVRFLYASAFLNPNEIQKDIINIGEPPVEDEEFSECVKTTLGRQQVVKLLTDFSLFKETLSSNLNVHQLVQEVILENLNQEEELQSINDAIRMLHYAFQNCSSPDELLSNETEERPSIICGDQSRFYNWHKLCLHSYDLVRHLKRMFKLSNVDCVKIFLPETARIVYECAVHLSANSKHDEAKEVVNFAICIFNLSNQQIPASSLFPHTMPLPELFRRQIQYSCNTPASTMKDDSRDGVEMPIPSVSSEQLEEMRMKGNDLFKNGFYNDALKIYSEVIDISKNTAFFDVMLLSNRASVYLKLGQYDEALQDAEEYILQRPKCWRGYAKKALALIELKNMQDACVAASIAYYYERNLFRDFEPFRRIFGSSMEKRLFVCHDTLSLSKALWKIRILDHCRNLSRNNSEGFPVVILENGDYLVSSHTIDSDLFGSYGKVRSLTIKNCILVGGEGECSITFDDNHCVGFGEVFMAYNVSFRTRFSNCHFLPDSVVKLTHCSFESSNNSYTSFCCYGELKVDSCKFYNCTKGGLLVVGDAEVENSTFFGNEVALEVREGGRLLVRKSRMYGNKRQGLLIGPKASECVVEDCELYDNELSGILVVNCASDVIIKGNRIYDNDEPGISVIINSNVSIIENKILKNNHWGILLTSSRAVIKENKIHNNQCGGIFLQTSCSSGRSVIEYNDICNNCGPGICDHEQLSKASENKFQNNKEKRNQSTAQSEAKLCYYCKKPENKLKQCTNCFTAQYCGRECQKSDWKNHKKVCDRFLSDGSIVVNYVRKPIMTEHLSPNKHIPFKTSERAPGLLPVGPQYCPPPDTTTRFIVKVSSAEMDRGRKDFNPSVVRLYDRSLKIDGILTDADQIHQLAWQHGTMGQLYSSFKKLFMWAKGPEHGKLRVFTNEFPPYQHW